MRKKRVFPKKIRLFRPLALLALGVGICFALTACMPGMAGRLFDWMTRDEASSSAPSSPSSEVEIPQLEDEDRRTIPFSEMEYKRPDTEALMSQIDALTQEMKAAESLEEVLEIDEKVSDITSEFVTMRNLAEVHKYLDVEDEYYDEESRFCEAASVEVENAINILNEVILEGPHAEAYKAEVGDYLYTSIANALRLSSKEVEDYKKERRALNADYNKKLAGLTLEYQGKEYTLEEIYEVGSYELTCLYYDQNVDWFADIYGQMIELDKKTAEVLGFESVADMYYLSYTRDYTPQQTLEYCDMVKEILTPILPSVMGSGATYPYTLDYETTFSKMPALMQSIDPRLETVWNDMIEYELCDYAPTKGKQSGIGFTTGFPSYDAPFSYGYWDAASLNSAFTPIHEFGHYYEATVHVDDDVVQNLDVAEIYSQALELLALGSLDTFMEETDGVVKVQMQYLLQSLTYQAMLEEFQLQVYELEDYSAENISKIYTDLLNEYGYGGFILAGESGYDNSWFPVTHLYDAPFYTISYATSGSTAVQFYMKSLQDRQGTIDDYMALVESDQNRPYLQLLSDAGLKSPFDESLLEEIKALYLQIYDDQSNAFDWAA